MGTHPIHLTMRADSAVASLRRPTTFRAVSKSFAAAAAETLRFRVLVFSVQTDHVHLVVEAEDKHALARGVQGLAVRLARAVNRARERRGRVWADRYHARALASPRAVRSALVYVLMNHRKHGHVASVVDPCSSGAWFTGFEASSMALLAGPLPRDGPAPVAAARTWLARTGWQRHGLLSITEAPLSPA